MESNPNINNPDLCLKFRICKNTNLSTLRNYNYHVILDIRFRNANSNDALLKIETSLVEKLTIARANADAHKGGYSQIIPVGYDKKAILNIENHSFNTNTITAIAYRRIGTND